MPALRKLPRSDSSIPGEGLSLRARGEIAEAIRACPYRLRTKERTAFLSELAREHRVTLGCVHKYQTRVLRAAREVVR